MGDKKQSNRKKEKERKKDVLIRALITQNMQLVDKNKEMEKKDNGKRKQGIKKPKCRIRRGDENIKSPNGEGRDEDEGIGGTIEH